MESLLLQATIYLAAAVIAVPLAARLGLGSVLGYLAAGIVIGFIPGLGEHTRELQHFAEFGVVVMLFLIGLELEPQALWGMKDRLLGLGGVQVLATTVLVMLALLAFGLGWRPSLAIGMIVALSSTAIVLQTLTEKGLMQTHGGRSVFSVLLTQDVAVIPMLAILPLLGTTTAVRLNADGSLALAADDAHHGLSLTEGLPSWGVTLVTLGAVAVVILAGVYLTRPVFRYIHQARLREMYTALALLIVISIAVLMSLVGLSPALGTFLAGVVLASSEFRHELESDLEPFKGLLLGLFFIAVGAGIDFGVLASAPFKIIGLTLGLIALKALVLYVTVRIFDHGKRDKRLFTLALAQAGEFGFVLTSFAVVQQVLTPRTAELVLLVIALSMLMTPLLFIAFDWLDKHRPHADDTPFADDVDEQGAVIIAGIGRFGQVVDRLVKSAGFKTVVLDHNLGAIQTMRKFGAKAFFGDPTRPDLLQAAGLDDARVLVVAFDDHEKALKLVEYARRARPDLSIIARAHDRLHVYELYRAGADHIVRELFDSSLRAGRYVLEDMGLSDFEAAEVEMTFYHMDRHMTKELAELWEPGKRLNDSPAYISRAKELNAEVETALLGFLDQERDGSTPPREDRGYRSKPRGVRG